MIAETMIVSAFMAIVVLLDMAVPRGKIRFGRGAFYLFWPIGETATRGGMYCREFHIICFGYEYHWSGVDDSCVSSRRWLTK